jgi:O-methyltransferase
MGTLIRRFVNRVGRVAGLYPPAPADKIGRPDISREERAILESVRPFTMTSDDRVLGLMDATCYIANRQIPGAIVECGVWRGGSTMAAALTLLGAGTTDRDIYLFDTFEGMTPPTGVDQSFDGVPAAQHYQALNGNWCASGLDEVRANMAKTGYPHDRFHYVRGRVEDTIPATCPDRIALLRLDTDWYESTKHELQHLYPRLVTGGVLIVDDYGHWSGCRKAVDEYFDALSTPLLLTRLDYSGRMAVKIGQPCSSAQDF